uniref:Uncharacterized protein n=1 Tax=Cacopsylla melanoneura TaxID=428564 RepID=A0A8D9E3B4_9HEMI
MNTMTWHQGTRLSRKVICNSILYSRRCNKCNNNLCHNIPCNSRPYNNIPCNNHPYNNILCSITLCSKQCSRVIFYNRHLPQLPLLCNHSITDSLYLFNTYKHRHLHKKNIVSSYLFRISTTIHSTNNWKLSGTERMSFKTQEI